MRRIVLLLALNLLAGLRSRAPPGTSARKRSWAPASRCSSGRRPRPCGEGHRRRDGRHAPHRRADEHLQAREPALAGQRSRVPAPGAGGRRHHRRRGESLEYSRLSDGAFDITYASVGYLYDYARTSIRRRPRSPLPSRGRLSPARVDREAPRSGSSTRHAHRPRRHRQGLVGGPRGRDPEGLGIEHAMVNAGGDTGFSATGLASPGSLGSAIHASKAPWSRASRCGTKPFRPRATTSAISRAWRALSPHPRAGHGKSPERCAA